jgi:hypothetical protein
MKKYILNLKKFYLKIKFNNILYSEMEINLISKCHLTY